MIDFSSLSLIDMFVGLVFSSLGMFGLAYGKRTANFQMMLAGGLLMVLPGFVTGWMLYAVCAGLSAMMWDAREP